MKKLLLSALFFTSFSFYAQVGINTETPKSTLEIKAKNETGTSTNVEGILIPKVDREKAQSMTTIPNSTLIFVDNISTGTLTGIASNIDASGYYYFESSENKWLKIATSKKAILADFGAGYTGTSEELQPTGTTITLPPGKWIVQTNILIKSATAPTAGRGLWVRLTWSDVSGGAKSSDILGAHLASGSLVYPSRYGMTTGSIIINNISGEDKTYHLTKDVQNAYGIDLQISELAKAGISENSIVAIPAN